MSRLRSKEDRLITAASSYMKKYKAIEEKYEYDVRPPYEWVEKHYSPDADIDTDAEAERMHEEWLDNELEYLETHTCAYYKIDPEDLRGMVKILEFTSMLES